VHSDLIKQQLIDQPEMRQAGDIRWNRDDTAVYVYLSPAYTRAAAQGVPIDKEIANLRLPNPEENLIGVETLFQLQKIVVNTSRDGTVRVEYEGIKPKEKE